jgi:hypothetical protein
MKKLEEPRVLVQVSLDPNLVWRVKRAAVNRKINLRLAVSEALDEWAKKVEF